MHHIWSWLSLSYILITTATSVPTFYTPSFPTREDGPNILLSFYWAWYALGIAIVIVATVIGIIMLVCACRKKKTEKDKQIPLKEL